MPFLEEEKRKKCRPGAGDLRGGIPTKRGGRKKFSLKERGLANSPKKVEGGDKGRGRSPFKEEDQQ